MPAFRVALSADFRKPDGGAADMRAGLVVMAGRVPSGIVNRDVLDRPGWQARLAGYARRFGDG